MDLGTGGAPPVEGGRKRLNLLPRTKPEADKGEDEGAPEPTSAAPAEMSEADVQKKVKEDIKVRLGVTWTSVRD
jgi:translation initiation factor 4G